MPPRSSTLPAFLAVLLLPSVAAAQSFLEAADPRSEEPAQPLPMVSTSLTVKLDRQFAESTLTQTFLNKTDDQLEGRYQLQLGEGARVSGFAYWNGTKKIVGEVFEKAVAAEIYGEITGLGRDPGLFEQVGEGAFAFRVFPITAREEKKVEVKFGRYLARTGDHFEYRLPLGDARATIELDVTDDRDLLAIDSPTHALTRVGSKLTATGKGELVVNVRVKEQPLTVRARVHRDVDQDAYVLLSMTAPDDATTKVAPKDITLVIDHSGSMQGDPMAHALAAADKVLDRLKPEDRVNVLMFDDTVDALYPTPRPVTDAVRAEAKAYVAKITSDGGTEIALALDKALAAQVQDDRPDVILFLTDGQSDAQAALKVARADAGDARVYTIGLGSGVEKPLLARLAAEKRGRFTFIPDVASVEHAVVEVFERIDHPVMIDLKVDGAQRMYPRTLPDLARGEELVVSARLPRSGDLVVTGTIDGKRVQRTVHVALPAAERRTWVGRQWAGARVEDLLQQIALTGETDELKNEAIELALAYNLVTPYTSFLALPEEELTDATAQTLADARARKKAIQAAHKDAAALSRDDMPPGDPVLSIRAPKDAVQVTAQFPFGLTKDLEWDTHDEQWKVRFLVPKDVVDGVYFAKIVIVRADGTIEIAKAKYTIDASEPDFLVTMTQTDAGVLVHVTASAGVTSVIAGGVTDPTLRVTFTQVGPSEFEAVLPLGVGDHSLRIVAADSARNEADRVLDVVVQ
ncbi:MAG: VWA domain-containing protein [Myxococcales bacterium]|nr:VWA domain-containing protein [Myxococcales bacterium]